MKYVRGATTNTIQAVKGSRTTERLGQDSNYGSTMDDDFIFRVADLEAAGVWPPERRDRVTWSDALGVPHQHRVAERDGAERCYDPVGQHGVLVRVHTVEIQA